MGSEFDAAAGVIFTLFLLLFSPSAGDGPVLSNQAVLRAQAQSAIALARTAGELRYDALTIDPRSGAIVIDGFSFASPIGLFDARSLRQKAVGGTDSLVISLDFDGLEAPPAAFGRSAQAMLLQAAPELTVLRASGAFEATYDWPESALRITLSADIEGLGAVDASASFSDLWADPEAPEPDQLRGYFDEGWLMVGDDGLRDAAELFSGLKVTAPTTALLVGQLAAAALAEEAGDRADEPAVREDIDAAVEAVVAFLSDGGRIMMTLRPDELIPFGDLRDMGLQSESAVYVISQLNPTFSNAPVPRGGVASPPVDGDVEATLDYAFALIEGEGAPRNLRAAVETLTPLAEGGDLEAQTMLSEALSIRALPGDASQAYGWAIQAWAQGVEEADDATYRPNGALATRASALGVGAQLAVEAALADDPTLISEEVAALIRAAEAGDAAAARDLAERRRSGYGAPRSLARAYRWALLAGAAGDRSGERIARSLETQFDAAPPDDRDAWRSMLAAEADAALALWSSAYAAQP